MPSIQPSIVERSGGRKQEHITQMVRNLEDDVKSGQGPTAGVSEATWAHQRPDLAEGPHYTPVKSSMESRGDGDSGLSLPSAFLLVCQLIPFLLCRSLTWLLSRFNRKRLPPCLARTASATPRADLLPRTQRTVSQALRFTMGRQQRGFLPFVPATTAPMLTQQSRSTSSTIMQNAG